MLCGESRLVRGPLLALYRVDAWDQLRAAWTRCAIWSHLLPDGRGGAPGSDRLVRETICRFQRVREQRQNDARLGGEGGCTSALRGQRRGLHPQVRRDEG